MVVYGLVSHRLLPEHGTSTTEIRREVLFGARGLMPATSAIRMSSQAFWFGADTALAALRMRA